MPAGLLAVSASNGSADSGASHSCHHLAVALGTFLSASFSLTCPWLCFVISFQCLNARATWERKEWLGRAHFYIPNIPCSSPAQGVEPPQPARAAHHHMKSTHIHLHKMTNKSHKFLLTHVEEKLPIWKAAGQGLSLNLEEIKLLVSCTLIFQPSEVIILRLELSYKL